LGPQNSVEVLEFGSTPKKEHLTCIGIVQMLQLPQFSLLKVGHGAMNSHPLPHGHILVCNATEAE